MDPPPKAPLVRPSYLLLAAAVLAACSFLIRHQQAVAVREVYASDRPDALKVLFIGNSHTFVNDLPAMFGWLVTAGQPDRPLKISQVVAPGLTLEQQWDQGEAQRRIREQGPWDFVVLQEQSLRPTLENDRYVEFARRFDAEVKQAHARTVLYLLWARKDWKQSQLEASRPYLTLAQEMDAMVAPAGVAWSLALQKHPDLQLYMEDGYHPRPEGTYLAACVFYGTLLGQSPVGLPGRLTRKQGGPGEAVWVDLPADLAADLQRVAWQAVQEGEAVDRKRTEPLVK